MFRILLIVIFFSFSLVNISKANFDVKARTAILQDYHSGEIIFEKDKQEIFMKTVLNDEEGISKISFCKKIEKFKKES